MGRVAEADRLKIRAKQFALRVIRLFQALPKTEEARIIGRQLIRSGTSSAANYRAACRARSRNEFVSKMNIVVEETDESLFWMELLEEAAIVSARSLSELKDEGRQLLAIFAASLHTARKGVKSARSFNG